MSIQNVNERFASFGGDLELKRDIAVAHSNLGTYLQKIGDTKEAIASYRRAIELLPDLTMAHHNLGNARKAQHKFDEAFASYRTASKPDLRARNRDSQKDWASLANFQAA